jgi:hypothetical protein
MSSLEKSNFNNDLMPNSNFNKIAAQLLGRPLKPSDGINTELLEKADRRLKLPIALKEFYSCVGNVDAFTSSFQHIFSPNDLHIKNNKLVFAEENQGVFVWGVDVKKPANETVMVYQSLDGEQSHEWVSEKISLQAFLELLLYYQCAAGGYEYSGYLEKKQLKGKLKEVINKWEKVVEHNCLTIYWNEGKLIWYFTDYRGKIIDMIYASARTEKDFKFLQDEFGFEG